jgi:hypothetical protein
MLLGVLAVVAEVVVVTLILAVVVMIAMFGSPLREMRPSMQRP